MKLADQLDFLARHRVEPGKREGHRVHAGPQIDDSVLPAVIGDGGPRLFDQGRTAGFDGDTGQHAPGGVSDDARKGALCIGCAGRQCQQRQTDDYEATTVFRRSIARLQTQLTTPG